MTPYTPAGQIVQQTNTLANTLHILFGQTEATVEYDGLATNAVGLYQFNVVVPTRPKTRRHSKTQQGYPSGKVY